MKKKSTADRGLIQKRNKATGKLEWYARIVRLNGEGIKKEHTAKAENKAEARKLRDELAEKFRHRGVDAIKGDKLLFRDVAELYKESKLHKAEYHGQGNARRKVSGVRSLNPSLGYLKVLLQFFGAKMLKNISYADLDEFRKKRLKAPIERGKKVDENGVIVYSKTERSIADVNRNLALMKSILKFAKEKRWISESPFEHGPSLISAAAETQRERVLSDAEEKALLAVCADRRSHLRPLIITALDTAMRRGEMLKLTWKSVDFANKSISVIALNTKTARARSLKMTERVCQELKSLYEASPKAPDGLVFGVKDNFQKSFTSACKDAGIEDLRFHDLRHTAITRLINLGVAPMQIMKLSGHTQMNTFARYVNPEADTMQAIAEKLDAYYRQPTPEIVASQMVN